MTKYTNDSLDAQSTTLTNVEGNPKVTIMLITYNHEKYIAQALESLLMQKTNFRFEINVIEDCSTDRTQEIVMHYVQRYPEIVKPFFNVKNIGYKVTQKNFYRGFLTLTGEYIAILEGDDYWIRDDKLQKQVDFLDANPDFVMVAGNTVKMYEDASQAPERFLYFGQREDSTIEDVINLRSFFHTTGLLYRNVLKQSPPRHFRNKWSCDIFIMIAHAVYGKLHHIDEDVAVYRAHSGGRFSNLTPIDGWFFNIDGLRRYNSWLGYRYFPAFAESIAGYCEYVMKNHSKDNGTKITIVRKLRLYAIWAFYRNVHKLFSFRDMLSRGSSHSLYVIGKTMLVYSRNGWLGRLDVIRPTALAGLPALPISRYWELIWGLHVAQLECDIGEYENQPKLLLTAHTVSKEEWLDRHAISQRIGDLIPGARYKVAVWVKPVNQANLQLQLRDGPNSTSGRIEHMLEARFDLTSFRVSLTTDGALSAAKIETIADGWLKATVDITTDNGEIFVYVGIVRSVDHSHTFKGNAEQLLLGPIETSLVTQPARPQLKTFRGFFARNI